MGRLRASRLVSLAIALLATGPSSANAGGLLDKVKDAVKDAADSAEAKKVQEALQGKGPNDVMEALKKSSEVSEALSAPEVLRAKEALGDVGAKVANAGAKVTVNVNSKDEPATTTAAPAVNGAGGISKEVGDALKSTSVGDLLSKSPSDIADSLKGTTAKDVADALKGSDSQKVTEKIGRDTSKLVNALQDSSPKDIADALRQNASGVLKEASNGLKKVKEQLEDSKVIDAIQNDPKSAVGAVQKIVGDVKHADLQGKHGKDVVDAVRGVGLSDVVDAIEHPKKNRLRDVIGKVSGTTLGGKTAAEEGDDEEGEPSEQPDAGSSYSIWVAALCGLLVVVGCALFRKLTTPKNVGRPMLAAEGTDMDTLMNTHGGGYGGPRDFMSQPSAPGFQRF